MVAILGQNQRIGHWEPSQTTSAVGILGGTVLDFRNARMGPGLHRINVVALLGSVRIIVPPGMPVEQACVPILGGIEQDEELGSVVADGPNVPRLKLTGVAILGAIEIHQQQLGESRRESRRRRKGKRKQRERDRQRRLRGR